MGGGWSWAPVAGLLRLGAPGLPGRSEVSRRSTYQATPLDRWTRRATGATVIAGLVASMGALLAVAWLMIEGTFDTISRAAGL